MPKLNLVLSIVRIDVRDWQNMVSFYEEALGFEPLALEPHHRYGWLKSGSIILALRAVENLPEGLGTRVSLQFEVENIETGIKALEEQGCHFYDIQLETGEGYKVAYFYDPEGNSLAIYTHTS